MEEFVAVKPLRDFYTNTIRTMTSYFREGSHVAVANLFDQYKGDESKFYLDQIYTQLLTSVKREALLFDKIYIVEDYGLNNPSKHLVTELEWLVEKNIVVVVKLTDVLSSLRTKEIRNYFESLYQLTDDTLEEKHRKLSIQTQKKMDKLEKELEKQLSSFSLKITPIDDAKAQLIVSQVSQMEKRFEKAEAIIQKWIDAFDKLHESDFNNNYPFADIFTRTYALRLEYFEKVIASPLLSYASYLQKVPNSRRSSVAQIVIHDLPLPDNNTAWEKIIEYRENNDNKNSLLALRRWIRKISEENLSMAEYKQELDWLKNEFQAHLKLHKIKANATMLETIIKAPLEVLENLVTLKFSKIPDPLFAIKKRRISLMEAELNAPGREIAYLIKSKQSFE